MDGVGKDFGVYPPEWPAIAYAIKEAAGWRCERCGHPDNLGYLPRGYQPCGAYCSHARDGKKRILTTHHLDRNKSNVREWNLAALCQVCHLQIQVKVDFFKDYALPHSEWMKRHVAGRDAARARGEWP